MPQLILVQSERCQPFVNAMEKHLKETEKVTIQPTLAEGIAIGLPMRSPEILEYIYKYGVKSAVIPEATILPTRAMLAEQGIYCEHTTAGVYAGYLQYMKEHGRTPDSLISMCGAGLKSDHA